MLVNMFGPTLSSYKFSFLSFPATLRIEEEGSGQLIIKDLCQ